MRQITITESDVGKVGVTTSTKMTILEIVGLLAVAQLVMWEASLKESVKKRKKSVLAERT